MNFVLGAVIILMVGGIGSLTAGRFPRLSNHVGAASAIVACGWGLVGLVGVFRRSAAAALILDWPVPYGAFPLAIDSLSGVFLGVVFLLAATTALYGGEYLSHYYGKRTVGVAWCSSNMLIASMILVLTARNAVLFLLAWELMSLSAFSLVLFEGEKKQVASAGLIYLIASHIGTLCLLTMFLLLANGEGSFDFARWATLPAGGLPSVVFVLALIGFGTKAGLMPLHIWLPEAHSAAPSHISAVMSGVMIKTGIYGLLRIVPFLGHPPAWWGLLLVAAGIISGIVGILFALAQRDMKRLLAYSSIEHIGIIAIGMGLGLWG